MKLSEKTIHAVIKGSLDKDAPLLFFEVLGRIILKEFQHIRLIGEIERPEGEETYHALRDSLCQYLKYCRIPRFSDDFVSTRNARAVISLYFVWTGIFEYGEEQGNEFWPHIFDGIKLPYDANVTAAAGRLFMQCLRENNLQQFPKITTSLPYVTRILLHGLIPERHIDRFINDFILPELSYEKARYETGETLIRKWENTSDLRYKPKPIQNFILHGKPVNAEVLERFWEMIGNWSEDDPGLWWRWGLPKYMVESFRRCVQGGRYRIQIRCRQDKKLFGQRPYISFDFETRDYPALNIPPQKARRNSSIELKTMPLSASGSWQLEINSPVGIAFQIGDEYFTESKVIPISPALGYQFQISDPEGNTYFQHHIESVFPSGNTGENVPIFLFSSKSFKLIRLEQIINYPCEIIIVYFCSGEIELEGGIKLTEPLRLSGKWGNWCYVVCELNQGCNLYYMGPDCAGSDIVDEIVFSKGDFSQGTPFLITDDQVPPWLRCDSNLPIICYYQKIGLLFPAEAHSLWRRAVGQVNRLDQPDCQPESRYFQLEFKTGLYGKLVTIPDYIRLQPGVYEIVLRGALGVEDFAASFVFLPGVSFDRTGPSAFESVADSFHIELGETVSVKPYENTNIEFKENRLCVSIKEDSGDAFCALRLFPETNYPITLLFAKSTVRWVRRNEKGLFLWQFWRARAEEIPIQRFDEIEDARVLIEIDDIDRHRAGKDIVLDKKNKLRLLLEEHEAKELNSRTLMSYTAPAFRRTSRSIWIIDLKKFSEQLKSLKQSPNADILLQNNKNTKVVLFNILRYPEFRNFRIRSIHKTTEKEDIEISWIHQENDPLRKRFLNLYPANFPDRNRQYSIADGKRPPFIIEIDAVKDLELWCGEINIQRSRFAGSRFSLERPNIQASWLRIPINWRDWLQFPKISPQKAGERLQPYNDLLDRDKLLTFTPWLYFLEIFHNQLGPEAFENLMSLVGEDTFQRMLPACTGGRWIARDASKKNLIELEVVSENASAADLYNCYLNRPPAAWNTIPAGVEIKLCTKRSYTPLGMAHQLFCCRREHGNGELIIMSETKSVPLAEWLDQMTENYGQISLVASIPIDSVWCACPCLPASNISQKRDFLFGRLALRQKSKMVKYTTAMAEALGDKLAQIYNIDTTMLPSEQDLSKIENQAAGLIRRWEEWVQKEYVNPLVMRIIKGRLDADPIQALPGATAFINRITAHDFGVYRWRGEQQISPRSELDDLLEETSDFVATYLQGAFLRDLILSEMLICWYWHQRLFEHLKQRKIQKSDAPHGADQNRILRSQPKKIDRQDVQRLWRQRGFVNGQTNIKKTFMNQFENYDIGTVIDRSTNLMWQKSGSEDRLKWSDAQKYVDQINHTRFAGYSDWRIATLEELGSLIVPSLHFSLSKQCGYFIDRIFSDKECWCWSADSFDLNQIWFVSFLLGKPDIAKKGFKNFVKVVRSI